MKTCFLLVSISFCLLFLSACDLIAPPPEDTPIPTQVRAEPTTKPSPTLGEPEYISAAYCWESHIDEAEYNLIRLFSSGNLIDVFVQPYSSCSEAWEATKDYLVEESLMQFNHGTYHLSGEQILFTLSPPNSEEIAGEVPGKYYGNVMMLRKGGAEEREYIQIYPGE